MAFDELKEKFHEAERSLRSYAESSGEYYKLKGFKFMMQGLSSAVKVLLVALAAMITLMFLSVSAAYAIGEELNNTAYGFLIVGLFYAITGLIIYALRHKLDRPLLKKFSEFYFDHDHE